MTPGPIVTGRHARINTTARPPVGERDAGVPKGTRRDARRFLITAVDPGKLRQHAGAFFVSLVRGDFNEQAVHALCRVVRLGLRPSARLYRDRMGGKWAGFQLQRHMAVGD